MDRPGWFDSVVRVSALGVIAGFLFLLAACAEDPALPGSDEIFSEEGVTVTASSDASLYRCRGYAFAVKERKNEAALSLPDGNETVLPRVPTPSGVKYQRGDTLFWTEGPDALLELGTRQFEECRLIQESLNDPARSHTKRGGRSNAG